MVDKTTSQGEEIYDIRLDVIGGLDERVQALEEKAEWANIYRSEDVTRLENRLNREGINTHLRIAELEAEMTLLKRVALRESEKGGEGIDPE